MGSLSPSLQAGRYLGMRDSDSSLVLPTLRTRDEIMMSLAYHCKACSVLPLREISPVQAFNRVHDAGKIEHEGSRQTFVRSHRRQVPNGRINSRDLPGSLA